MLVESKKTFIKSKFGTRNKNKAFDYLLNVAPLEIKINFKFITIDHVAEVSTNVFD